MSVEGSAMPPERSRPSGSSPLSPELLLREIARHADDKKAIDVIELDLRGVLGYTDYFLVCSGNTGRQAKAIHDGILAGLKHEHELLPRRVEGSADAGWILMDYLDVVVHVFTPDTREFYRLEHLWGEAPARPAVLPVDGATGDASAAPGDIAGAGAAP
ncbi:MAG TPA: ribosome silencing factor [Solirubrobacteraceae bacterium]|jgi:ribosome-associated protein|nr:ribosome silencing factor [Solirubrobacteraceae bacterium]